MQKAKSPGIRCPSAKLVLVSFIEWFSSWLGGRAV
jgi:hypothetical protein